jgi:hypothetical protein
MTENTSTAPAGPALHAGVPAAGGARPDRAPVASRYLSWIPTWGLIATKHLELRKRRGLMLVAVLLIVGLPVLVLGLRLIFHAADPKSYGPAGTPGIFQDVFSPMNEFGFIIAATLGAAAGTTDLTDGMFRHLVITGRSRVVLYLARIPAGLSIILPLVAVAFTVLCLVTSYAGTPQPAAVNVNGINVPVQLSEAQLKSWLLQHPGEYEQAFINGPPGSVGPSGPGPATSLPSGAAQIRRSIDRNITTAYGDYISSENGQLNPAVNEMVKIGLWLALDVGLGFLVGLGLGALTGQRTLSTVLMIVLEIIITPILGRTQIPYFINGQRLVVGVAMEQLRPAGLASGTGGGGGPGHVLFGGRGALGIPPMPTWAMIAVIVGWIVGWSVLGAWRMSTRDA